MEVIKVVMLFGMVLFSDGSTAIDGYPTFDQAECERELAYYEDLFVHNEDVVDWDLQCIELEVTKRPAATDETCADSCHEKGDAS